MSGRMRTKLTARGPRRQPPPHHLLSEESRPTKEHYKILALCWAGWVFDIYDLILFTFLIRPIGMTFSLTKLELSYALGASLAASAVGGIVFGALADLYGRKRVLEWTTGHTYIGETFPPRYRGRYASVMQTGGAVGCLMAAAVGGFLEPRIGWRWGFVISALPAVISAFVRRQLPESDVWLERHPEARKGRPLVLPSPKAIIAPIRALLTGPHRRDFLRSTALCTLDMSAFWIAFSWLPTYFEEQRGMSITSTAATLSIAYLGVLIGQLVFGYLADRIGRRTSFTLFSFVMAAGLLAITLFWGVTSESGNFIECAMFVTGFGAGMFGGYGPMFSELFPTAVRNTAMGGAYNLARGTQFLTPLLVALIAERYGLSGGISLAAAFAVANGLFVWTFPATSNRMATEIE